MNTTIWKFAAAPHDTRHAEDFTIEMPRGAQVISVHNQHGEPQLWALVDPEAPLEERRFAWRGTGHPLDWPAGCTARFVGTVLVHDDRLVFHLFELGS